MVLVQVCICAEVSMDVFPVLVKKQQHQDPLYLLPLVVSAHVAAVPAADVERAETLHHH
jgi:hypothetical protein